jgi:hypothetical protein
MMPPYNRVSAKQFARYVGLKLIEIFAIIALGFWSMYVCEDLASATLIGICYLIAIGAVIIVLNVDDYERKLKMLFKSGKL